MKSYHFHWMKYLLAYLAPVGTLMGMISGGWIVWIPIVFAFVIVPAVELIIKPDPSNLEAAEAAILARDPLFDILIWLMVPFQWLVVVLFLHRVNDPGLPPLELAGLMMGMGLMCGIIGINVGHELGHRTHQAEQFMAKLLLLSSLYMHFFIEHNRGHHKRVGTPDDPASARYNESLFSFWYRSVTGSYFSAWKIENRRLEKNGKSRFSFHNEMIVFHVIQLGLLVAIGCTLGWKSLVCFLASAGIGILLLEAVNYIEHYGLARRKKNDGSYGRTMHCHSWNSDHVLS